MPADLMARLQKGIVLAVPDYIQFDAMFIFLDDQAHLLQTFDNLDTHRSDRNVGAVAERL